MLAKVNLYWQTIRYLRPVQFYRRLWFKTYRRRPRTPKQLTRAKASSTWQQTYAPPQSMFGPRSFRLLNRQHTLDTNCNWVRGEAALWHYQVNYFDDLLATDAVSRKLWHRALIQSWIRENQPGTRVSWDPYPISLRLVNWVKWLLQGNDEVPGMIASIEQQACWLSRNLEWHLLGNHLLANAKALIFVGAFFDTKRSKNWLAQGIAIVQAQLREQILDDGGHFELSPMYHSIMLADLLDLLQLDCCFAGCLGVKLRQQIEAIVPKMLTWLEVMSHPDGEISYFNDAVAGAAPSLSSLRKASSMKQSMRGLSQGLGQNYTLTHLPESGYIALNLNNAKVILDVARIGPDYLPGHAHADTLSFEMSLGPDRLFVNTGTSTYEPGAERLAERATAAHNTVVVNNSNSSQVWSSFRVAGRAYPLDLSIEQQPKEAIISCGHTGYQTLSRDLRHYREWRANANSLQIIDRLTTSAKQIPAVAYYYLHPDIVVTQLAPNLISLATLSGLQALLQLGVGKLSVTDSKYALGFGNKVLAKCLRISLVNNRVEVNITWNN